MVSEISKIFDENQMKQNLERALRDKSTYLETGFLYEHVASELIDRISNPHIEGEFKKIAELGFRNSSLAKLVSQTLSPDIYDAYIEIELLKNLVEDKNADYINFKPLQNFISSNNELTYDLILNNLSFTIFNNLPNIFMHINQALKKGGHAQRCYNR